ncbi:protein-L-isoaspartate(D-aspartate) O-methyltransferase [Nitratireductor sp. ZSWI3]|uniref:protein-L-isoaspartate(D-aspartate) O-methyltransferase n=1 Tax=Nitratireductor sp. ZSWI3 TaxID=2966359 RepID=UPI0021500953|nr:protein-L-isoaspartate(D-aspartate) O-methyltransferase [Nitratireductor sp. ZSWI3]MCR4268049.1 protein-L-isoaspartate(D-aspartate) O-methyltransferase [Nitratireductor sp. ZSWI3]
MTDSQDNRIAERRQAMAALLRKRGIRSQSVLDAMERVPRHAFVPGHLAELAYEDGALPIGEGQTISQPYIVALMTEAAGIDKKSRVLEIGTGSGYSTAILSAVAGEVYSVERHEALAEAARQRLEASGFAGNVSIRVGDGTLGWPDKAPFDAIIVAAAGPRIPDALQAQLAVGGKLVMPVGAAAGAQALTRVVRDAADDFRNEALAQVSFVPLIGAQGWQR